VTDTNAYRVLTGLGLTAEQVRREADAMKWG